jgi:hypothetical protein
LCIFFSGAAAAFVFIVISLVGCWINHHHCLLASSSCCSAHVMLSLITTFLAALHGHTCAARNALFV